MLLTEFSQEFRSSVSCFQFSEIYKPLDSTWYRGLNQTWRREPRVQPNVPLPKRLLLDEFSIYILLPLD